MNRIRIRNMPGDKALDRFIDIFGRHVRERIDGVEVIPADDESDIVMTIDESLAPDSFELHDSGSGIQVSGGNVRGVLYGIGRLLHDATFDAAEGFLPASWRGHSAPARKLRGMYFATHFHNFYEDAPIDKVLEYIEDLCLWGYNSFMTWIDLDYYPSIDCRTARSMIGRMKVILGHAAKLGMDTGIISVSNQGYAHSPEEWKAVTVKRPHGKNPLCIARPGVREAIIESRREQFELVADINPKYLCLWPYDPGGCACESCAPWGGNGYLDISADIARLFREHYPDGKVILSTWFFDHGDTEGEWSGLARAMDAGADWVDYIMAEGTSGSFPSYPLTNGVPGGLPMIGFPEISMWHTKPWGGFGANPGVNRFQKIWDSVADRMEGGFPYSEGIFEDINKVLYSRFYWDDKPSSRLTAENYIRYEYSPDVVDDVMSAMDILEENNCFRWSPNKGEPGVSRQPLKEDAGSVKACDLLSGVDSRLPDKTRQSWRWRILLLRSIVDKELYGSGGESTPVCEDAFHELTRIYHAEKALFQCAPPSEEAIAAMRGGEDVEKLDMG